MAEHILATGLARAIGGAMCFTSRWSVWLRVTTGRDERNRDNAVLE